MAVDDSDCKVNQQVLALQVELDRVLGLPPHKRLAALRAKYQATKQPIWQVLVANFDVLEHITPAPFSINRRPPPSFSERVAQEKAKQKKAQTTLLEARAKLIAMLGEKKAKKKKLTSPARSSSPGSGGCTEVLEKQKFRRYFAVRSRQLSPSYKEAVLIRSRRPGGWRLWCRDNNGFFCKRRETMINGWQHYFTYVVIQYADFCGPSLWEHVDKAEETDEEGGEDSDEEHDEDPGEEDVEGLDEDDTDGSGDECCDDDSDDNSDGDSDDDSDDDSEIGQDDIDNCTEMVRQQLIHQGKFREAERLNIQKHDLDVEDYICLLSTVVTDSATQMSTCIQNAVTNTDHINRELKERRWKYNYLRRRIGTDYSPYPGLADGRPSPLRAVTNAEDLKDNPCSESKASKKPQEGLWGDEEEEEARREFVATWDEDDAISKW
ncbi:hypothetical protein F4776DRAFT_662524 [Hypoxylon sp. NC0597]|nr:hypothetical protein F4776DRAFT_662524 [Hypoxylon sp. NC0597]